MKLKALALLVALSVTSLAPAFAAPTTLTVQQQPSMYSTIAPAQCTIPMVAGDSVNGNTFASTSDEIIIAQNTHATLAYTITISSAADNLGRTKDIATYNLNAGDIACFGPFPSIGWLQSGKLVVTVSNAAVKIGLMRLPTNR